MESHVLGLVALAKLKIVRMPLILINQWVNARNGYLIALSIIQFVWIRLQLNVIVWIHLLLTLNVMSGVLIAL